jgi:mitogen-activated protein kinase 15
MTQYVAARWYRPPEVILAKYSYDYAVDMWAIGCVMAELLLKRPLFAGESTLDQLEKILSVIGMPKKNDIEALDSIEARQLLSNFSNIKKLPLSEVLFDAGD